MASKVDFKRQITTYSARRGRFDVVTVPTMRFLMVDGHGDPNTSEQYERAIASLYPVAYRLKFFSKEQLGRDYTVMPLEALWWSDDMDAFTSARDKSRWDWTVMTMTPEWISEEHLELAREAVQAKAGTPPLEDLRLEQLEEGLCVQTLHIGSYDDEGPVLDELHRVVIPGRSLRMAGRHHEVYLSDPRRTAASALKTILRQPVTVVAAE